MSNIQSNPLDQWLTPESMLTPGVAGALVMMCTNALATEFGAPRASTGLLLSFLIGLLVFSAARALWIRGVFYIINSLIIFCMALGSNAVGVTQTKNLSLTLIGTAFAQSATTESGAKLSELIAEQADLLRQFRALLTAQSNGERALDDLKIQYDRNFQILTDNLISSRDSLRMEDKDIEQITAKAERALEASNRLRQISEKASQIKMDVEKITNDVNRIQNRLDAIESLQSDILSKRKERPFFEPWIR